jgi:hypothetical protein
MQSYSNFQRIFWKLCTHTLTRLKSSFSKTTSHFSSVSSGILLLGLDRISSNFFILLSFSTSVWNIILLLVHSAFLQLSMSFSIGFSEFQQIYKYYEIHTCITISFIYYSYIFIMLPNALILLVLKYVAHYTQFSHQKAWLIKAKLFHEPNR